MPFPSSKKSHFQNEAKCETFVVKMSFICIIIENHFHINGFALSLVLKVRFFGTRKWPIQEAVADPDLQIRGEGGHPDPEIRGVVSKKTVRPLRPHFGLKIRGGRALRAPPLYPLLGSVQNVDFNIKVTIEMKV